jgi:hypothetical protein
MDTDEIKPLVIGVLTALLQDNVGNRITTALANGMLHGMEQELSRAEFIARAKANNMDLGKLDGVLVPDPAPTPAPARKRAAK